MLAVSREGVKVPLSGQTGFKSEFLWQEPPSSGCASYTDCANCAAALPACVRGGLMLNPLCPGMLSRQS